VVEGLAHMDQGYLHDLMHTSYLLPQVPQILNAFTLPKNQVHAILFGESPYPRAASANGFAFWDNAVNEIWSPTGFSKQLNRATSLRNFLKMLLVAENYLDPQHLTQPDIAALDKNQFITHLSQLFERLLQRGTLLLNASLVLSNRHVQEEARLWHPFIQIILHSFAKPQDITLLLWGNIAKIIAKMPTSQAFNKLIAEHPYNLSFITNPEIQTYFGSLHLLKR
jgi:uracil-DNA glycosylase